MHSEYLTDSECREFAALVKRAVGLLAHLKDCYQCDNVPTEMAALLEDAERDAEQLAEQVHTRWMAIRGTVTASQKKGHGVRVTKFDMNGRPVGEPVPMTSGVWQTNGGWRRNA